MCVTAAWTILEGSLGRRVCHCYLDRTRNKTLVRVRLVVVHLRVLCFRACRANVVYDARLVPFVSRSLSDARGRPRMATNDGNGPFGAIAEFFSPSRPASAPLDAQTDHNNTAHNNPANISPVNLDMSSGSGTEPDHDASAHPSARDTASIV